MLFRSPKLQRICFGLYFMHEPVTEVRGSQIRRLQLVELSLSNTIRVNEFKQTPFFRGIMQIFLDKLDAKLCL